MIQSAGPSAAPARGTGVPIPDTFDIVIPTTGRPELRRLVEALLSTPSPPPDRLIVVDDRRTPGAPLELPETAGGRSRIDVVRGPGRGPAAARNVGWRAGGAPWVAFLDDDVVPPPGWLDALRADLAGARPAVGGSQGRVRVPLPTDRRPTDWERSTAGLERARWATADMAYRRAALAAVGGFDERFRRAYREDADLGLRVVAAGWRIERGDREILHPVRPADRWVSLRAQAGNADDPLMRRLHGPDWRVRAHAPAGRRRRPLAVTAAAVAAPLAAAFRRPRLAASAAAVWVAGTADLAWARIAPGPRTRDEVLTMLATSAVLPQLATAHWLRGVATSREATGAR